MKKIILLAAVVAATVTSCSTTDSTTNNDGDSTKTTTTSTASTTSDGKTTVENGITTIAGTNTYEFSVIGKGNYILTLKEKELGNIEDFQFWSSFENKWDTWQNTTGVTAGASGYLETVDVIKITSDTIKGKVTAKGEYIIEFKKFPTTATADATPKSYTGSGRSVFGPFILGTSTTITLTCADAKQAGLSLQLFDANGDEILTDKYQSLYTNFKDGKSINAINETITKSGLTAGNFYINVDANGGANYTVLVK